MSDEQSPPGLLSRYRSLGLGRQRRIMAISGGGSVGLGVGIALAWTLGIYQRANPQTINFSSAYPPMALTVFVVVIIAGLAIGLGVGFMLAALIGHHEADPATQAPPQD